MKLSVNNISERLCEVTVDDINSGILTAKEAKDFAINLIQVANDLLELEDYSKSNNK